MTIRYPQSATCNAVIRADTPIEEVFAAVRAALVARDGFVPGGWMTIADVVEKTTAGAFRPGLPPRDAVKTSGAERFAAGFAIDGAKGLNVIVIPLTPQNALDDPGKFGMASGWWVNEVFYDFTSGQRLVSAIAAQVELIRAIAETLPVLAADVRRKSTSFLGPIPPHADPDVVAALVTTDQVAAEYATAGDYWAAWDRVEHLGRGQALVSRAVGIADETDFKEAILERSFALGRAARPGLTKYFEAEPSREEAEMLAAMPHHLEQVGYDRVAKTLEFSCSLPKGAHLSPADFFTILAFQSRGTAAGEDVDEVILSFVSREMAESEIEALNDVGEVRAQYLDDDGRMVVVSG